MKGQRIFRTHFSYFRLPRKCGHIQSDIRVSENCNNPNRKWSERQDPDNCSCFLSFTDAG